MATDILEHEGNGKIWANGVCPPNTQYTAYLLRWTDVKDRLPKFEDHPYQTYLVWKKAPKGPIEAGIAETEQFNMRNQAFTNRGFFGYCEITHWMPLPEAPGLNLKNHKD